MFFIILQNGEFSFSKAKDSRRSLSNDFGQAEAFIKQMRAPKSGNFKVGPHGEMPSPRGGTESQHGVMSRWMEENFSNYNPNKAPAVLMDIENHNATRRAFNAWRAERGGKVDWSKVSDAEIRQLSERLFDAAEVPAAVRAEYYKQFEAFVKTLTKQ